MIVFDRNSQVRLHNPIKIRQLPKVNRARFRARSLGQTYCWATMRLFRLSVFFILALSMAGCRDSNEYHEAMMKKAYNTMMVKPENHAGMTAYSIDETQKKRFERHRDILVERGVLFKKVYVLENIRSTTEQANAVLKTLLRSPPYPVVDFSSPHTDEGQRLEITLWGRQEHKEGWDRFMRSRDLPAQPDGAANRSQPIRSQTNSTSSAAGSRR
jgi:hypothetical protein